MGDEEKSDPNPTLYAHYRKLADEACQRAEDGDCMIRWYRYADLLEKECQYSDFSPFQKELSASLMIGRFNLWRKEHEDVIRRHRANKAKQS